VNLDVAFRLSSVLLAASGFAGLVLTGELPPGLALAGAAALAASLAHALGHGPEWGLFRLSQQTWTGLMITAFLFMFADLFWISGDLLQAGIHFLVALMVQKLFTLRERKDFLHLYAISLMELLGAAALTLELWYAAVFAAYLLTAIWTLLLYHLRSEAEEARSAHAQARQPGTITSRFFWSTNGVAIGALCLTLLIFIVTPRIGAGFFEKNRGDLIRMSGFSEKVDLGMVGSVKLDNTVVMRVEFPDLKGPLTERTYFRGASYDVYDGRSWSNTLRDRQALARSPEGDFIVAMDGLSETERGFRQDILVEALDTSVLFGVPLVESVKGTFSTVLVDGMGDVSLSYVPAVRFQYSVRSIPTRLSADDRGRTRTDDSESIRRRFLQLPAVSQRVAELARQIVQPTASRYDMAVAMEQHLQQNYEYSLDLGTASTLNPVEDFLFVRKTGYCDHYATAMVILLRTLGIPSRLATGFAQGEWNDVGSYYTVRQRDAHAWVEVYFPNSGWVTFDPTPNIPLTLPHPLVVRAGKVLDSIRLKWDRFVIRYSFRDQMAMARGVREQGEAVRAGVAVRFVALLRWSSELRARTSYFWQSHGWFAAGGAIMLCVLAGLIFMRRFRHGNWWKSRKASGPTIQQMAAVKLYSQMLQLLRSRGLTKTSGMTPFEFAGKISREWAEAGQFVTPLTQLYCRVRFGQVTLSQDDHTHAQILLNKLRAMLQTRGGPLGFVVRA
jgi:transglutaminase-like putative cysteine protease